MQGNSGEALKVNQLFVPAFGLLALAICVLAGTPSASAQQPKPGPMLTAANGDPIAAPATVPVPSSYQAAPVSNLADPNLVPQIIRYSGSASGHSGQTVEATFRIYASPDDPQPGKALDSNPNSGQNSGQTPLWSESQQIEIDSAGKYSVLLGAATQGGIPQSLFAGGQAQWLTVSINREAEQPRINLASVPYAMKAADAQTLAGHAPQEFVTHTYLSAQITAEISARVQSGLSATAQSLAEQATSAAQPLTSLTGGGKSDYLPLWTNASKLSNSVIFQGGTANAPRIGIGTQSPANTLDLNGSATIRGGSTIFGEALVYGDESLRHSLSMSPSGAATRKSGASSGLFSIAASSFSSTTGKPLDQTFAWQVVPTENNTRQPSAALELLFSTGATSPTPTGLSVSSRGILTFADGQRFPVPSSGPGSGTLTGIRAGTALIGGGTSGTPTLELDITKVPLLKASNTFTGNQTIHGSQEITGSQTIGGNQAIKGNLTMNGALSAASLSVATLSASSIAAQSENLAGTLTAAAINARGPISSQNSLTLAPSTSATAANSNQSATSLNLEASAFNSSTRTAANQIFSWTASPVNNNTATPSAQLQLGFGNAGPDSVSSTGLSISNTGILTFASGQKFPGITTSGAITAVTANAPLTSTGGSGTIALGLNMPALQSTLNSIYAQVGSSNTFTGTQAIAGNETISGTLGVTGPVSVNGAITAQTNSGAAITTTATHGATGVTSQSDTGNGIVGQSLAPTNGFAGVEGFAGSPSSHSLQNYESILVAGVWGDTTGNPNGVSAAGIIGTSDTVDAGIFLNNSNTDTTVYAENSGTSDGIYGVADQGGNGVGGFSKTTGIGVLGAVQGNSQTYASMTGSSAGLWGDTSLTTAIGAVVGTTDNGTAGYFDNNSGTQPTLTALNQSPGAATGLFQTFKAVTREGSCGIGGKGDLACTGQVKSLATSATGRTVETYAMQSAESWMEDFGTGSLQAGAAVVNIDPAFAETVSSTADYHVFLTPRGDCKGLYVTNLTASSFEVRELGSGKASVTFDYRIVAKRRGHENQRLVDVTETFNREQSATTAMLNRKSTLPARPIQSIKPSNGSQSHPKRNLAPHMPVMVPPITKPAASSGPAASTNHKNNSHTE